MTPRINKIAGEKEPCRRKNNIALSPESPVIKADPGMKMGATCRAADVQNMDCLTSLSPPSEYFLLDALIPIGLVTGHDTVSKIGGINPRVL